MYSFLCLVSIYHTSFISSSFTSCVFSSILILLLHIFSSNLLFSLCLCLLFFCLYLQRFLIPCFLSLVSLLPSGYCNSHPPSSFFSVSYLFFTDYSLVFLPSLLIRLTSCLLPLLHVPFVPSDYRHFLPRHSSFLVIDLFFIL